MEQEHGAHSPRPWLLTYIGMYPVSNNMTPTPLYYAA